MADFLSAALGVGGLASNFLGNALQQDNFADQMNFAKYQYEDSKRYNSAQEQVKRLRAAGMNPAFAFGQNAGTAAAVSQPSQPTYNPLDLNGLSSLGSAITLNDSQKRVFNSEAEKNENEAQGVATDNLFRSENWKSLMYNRDTQSWLNDKLSEAAKLDVQYNALSMKNRLLKLQFETQLQDAELAMKDITMQYMVPEIAARINESIAHSAALYMTGRASLKSAHAAMLNAANQAHAFDAQYGGNPDDRQKFFNATLGYLVQQKNESKGREWNAVTTGNPLPYNSSYTQDYFDWKGGKLKRFNTYLHKVRH